MKTSWVAAFAASCVALLADATIPSSAAVITEDWTFTGSPSGSGQVAYDTTTGEVSAFTGTYGGKALTFWDLTSPPIQMNDPSPGLLTYHGVPNTGGADYILDNLFPLTVYGILVSTGSGASQVFYDLSLDYAGGPVDFFSITKSGVYVFNDGTFATAAPEPATWAMMMLGFVGLGFAGYRRTKSRGVASSLA